MADLSLEEAAKVIGVPAPQLRIWAYDKTGPENSGTRIRPAYRTEHLKQWLATQGRAIDRSIG